MLVPFINISVVLFIHVLLVLFINVILVDVGLVPFIDIDLLTLISTIGLKDLRLHQRHMTNIPKYIFLLSSIRIKLTNLNPTLIPPDLLLRRIRLHLLLPLPNIFIIKLILNLLLNVFFRLK